MQLEEFAIIKEESERKMILETDQIKYLNDHFMMSEWYIESIQENDHWHTVTLLKGYVI